MRLQDEIVNMKKLKNLFIRLRDDCNIQMIFYSTRKSGGGGVDAENSS